MSDTNMDFSKKSNQDAPQLEFSLPVNEVGEVLQIGDKGTISIPVEVTAIDKGIISFRKSGKASTQTNWQQATTDEIRSTLPVKE